MTQLRLTALRHTVSAVLTTSRIRAFGNGAIRARRWRGRRRRAVAAAVVAVCLFAALWTLAGPRAFVPQIPQSLAGLSVPWHAWRTTAGQQIPSRRPPKVTRGQAASSQATLQDQYELEEDRRKSIGRLVGTSAKSPVASGIADFDEAVFDKDRLEEYVGKRPFAIAQRFMALASIVFGVWQAWQEDTEAATQSGEDAFDATSFKQNKPATNRGKALRKGLADMGVFFVKIGQTLAQRPDLVGDELAEELKGLQEQNAPFDDGVALKIIAEDLNHTGPLAPGVYFEGCDKSGPALLAELTPKNVASASLGQVYKGKLWDGREVALKVQRPGVRDVLGLDWAIAVLVVRTYQSLKSNSQLNDYSLIVDTAARGIRLELDYHEEAANAREFAIRHSFLPFVSSPEWIPEFTGPEGSARVLCLQWYPSRAPSELSLDERRSLVRMAVQACVVQLLVTGFVHADPHEGNLRLGDDGRVVFLDFGLMDRVDFGVMESFASGIRSVLNEDWVELVHAMQASRFTPTPLLKYVEDPETGEKGVKEASREELAAVVGDRLKTDAGGTSRFGAMATTLKTVSNSYVMLTPPYVALLARTFITLEGMLADDPLMSEQFNIYEAALPFAIARVLSPRTRKGQTSMRSTLLNGSIPDWQSLVALMSAGEEDNQVDAVESSPAHAAREDDEDLGASVAVQQRLLHTAEGTLLRRLLYNLDGFAALGSFLMSPAARPLRHKAVELLSERLSTSRPRSKTKLKQYLPRSSAAAAGWARKQRSSGRRAWRLVLRRQLRRLVWPPHRILLVPVLLTASSSLLFRAAIRAARLRRQSLLKH